MKTLKETTLTLLVAFQVFALINANVYAFVTYLSGEVFNAMLLFIMLNVGICLIFHYLLPVVAFYFDTYSQEQGPSNIQIKE